MLYTKLRPKRFGEVLGQPTAEGLRKFVANDVIPHAILLSGPRGCGKTSIARIFVKAVNCESPEDGEPCLKCTACKRPHFLERDAGAYRNESDAAGLKNFLKLRPRYRWQVVIIDEAHALTKAAQTSLLKVIEEPPARSVIFLLTTEPTKLDDALKSRCQWWPIHVVSLDIIKRHLLTVAKSERIRLHPDAAILIARESTGSVRTALSLLEAFTAYKRPITAKMVRWALSTVNVDGLVRNLADNDLPAALHEVERLNGQYSMRDILVTTSKALMGLAVRQFDQDRSKSAASLSRMAAHLMKSSRVAVYSEIAHLQVALVEALNLDSFQFVKIEGLFTAFRESLEYGVQVGFYPVEILSELLMLGDVVVDESDLMVRYSHFLDQPVSDAMQKAFGEFTGESYTWEAQPYESRITNRRVKSSKSRIKKRHTSKVRS